MIVGVYLPGKLQSFLESFYSKTAGEDFDLIFVHNLEGIEDANVPNTYARTAEEVKQVQNLLQTTYEQHYNVTVYERTNTGRDLGALWYGYNKVRDQYKYYCFLNERVSINTDNWLSLILEEFNSDRNIGATGPQLCKGIKYDWCFRCFYWAQTNESIKTMNWWEPKTRDDAHIQEMELVYPHVINMKYNCSQIGNGYNIMSSDISEVVHSHPFTITK